MEDRAAGQAPDAAEMIAAEAAIVTIALVVAVTAVTVAARAAIVMTVLVVVEIAMTVAAEAVIEMTAPAVMVHVDVTMSVPHKQAPPNGAGLPESARRV